MDNRPLPHGAPVGQAGAACGLAAVPISDNTKECKRKMQEKNSLQRQAGAAWQKNFTL